MAIVNLSDEARETIEAALLHCRPELGLQYQSMQELRGKIDAALAAIRTETPPLICAKCNDYLEPSSYCEVCYGTLLSALDEAVAAQGKGDGSE